MISLLLIKSNPTAELPGSHINDWTSSCLLLFTVTGSLTADVSQRIKRVNLRYVQTLSGFHAYKVNGATVHFALGNAFEVKTCPCGSATNPEVFMIVF